MEEVKERMPQSVNETGISTRLFIQVVPGSEVFLCKFDYETNLRFLLILKPCVVLTDVCSDAGKVDKYT
jgi:hypothetical protein